MSPTDLFTVPIWMVIAGIFGAVWGSFANVVIYRVPQGASIAFPASHCLACGSPIAPYDNIPVLSFVLLRGRCRACGSAISPQYAVIEISLGLLSASCFRSTVLLADTFELVHVMSYLLSFAFCWTLVVVAFIDLSTHLIHTPMTTAMTIVGFAGHLLLPGGRALDAVIGFAAGFGVSWLITKVSKLFYGQEALGLGDAHVMGMIGAFLGWQGALVSFMLGAVQSVLAMIILVAARKSWRKGPVSPFRRYIPLGPFLAAGALEYVVFDLRNHSILRWIGL